MKRSLFVAPIIAIYLLASCGGSKRSEYHTITFHSNGGTEIPVLEVEDGKLAVEPKEPIKTNLLFKGWYQEETFENYFSFSTKITKDYDLYANWQSKYDFTVALQSEGRSTLEKTGGWLDLGDYKSEIHLTEGLAGKYDLCASKDYYEVSVNGQVIDTFSIDKVEYSPNEYYVVITIPKEYLGENVVIKSIPYCHYLTFTGETDESKIYYYYPKSAPSLPIDIEYCTDLNEQNWQDWADGKENAITLKGDKKTIYVKNTQNTLSSSSTEYVSFSTGVEGSPGVSADGNIMSLINFKQLTSHCFYSLFENCYSLTSSPVLSATVLADNCYAHLFYSCSSLAEAPKLPVDSPYGFCYDAMFCECASLKRAPLIAFKFFAEDSFGFRIFGNCSTLSYIKVCFEEPMLSSDPAEYRLMGWVAGVAPQGTFVCPKLCADKDTYSDFSNKTIPVGWTIDNDMSH
ncbi:MAG: InlB B-repeat-containing protein [Bacilli bacterium]|nr:InlB B-repeat-containing protein [Bacilli bacterium]